MRSESSATAITVFGEGGSQPLGNREGEPPRIAIP